MVDSLHYQCFVWKTSCRYSTFGLFRLRILRVETTGKDEWTHSCLGKITNTLFRNKMLRMGLHTALLIINALFLKTWSGWVYIQLFWLSMLCFWKHGQDGCTYSSFDYQCFVFDHGYMGGYIQLFWLSMLCFWKHGQDGCTYSSFDYQCFVFENMVRMGVHTALLIINALFLKTWSGWVYIQLFWLSMLCFWKHGQDGCTYSSFDYQCFVFENMVRMGVHTALLIINALFLKTWSGWVYIQLFWLSMLCFWKHGQDGCTYSSFDYQCFVFENMVRMGVHTALLIINALFLKTWSGWVYIQLFWLSMLCFWKHGQDGCTYSSFDYQCFVFENMVRMGVHTALLIINALFLKTWSGWVYIQLFWLSMLCFWKHGQDGCTYSSFDYQCFVFENMVRMGVHTALLIINALFLKTWSGWVYIQLFWLSMLCFWKHGQDGCTYSSFDYQCFVFENMVRMGVHTALLIINALFLKTWSGWVYIQLFWLSMLCFWKHGQDGCTYSSFDYQCFVFENMVRMGVHTALLIINALFLKTWSGWVYIQLFWLSMLCFWKHGQDGCTYSSFDYQCFVFENMVRMGVHTALLIINALFLKTWSGWVYIQLFWLSMLCFWKHGQDGCTYSSFDYQCFVFENMVRMGVHTALLIINALFLKTWSGWMYIP